MRFLGGSVLRPQTYVKALQPIGERDQHFWVRILEAELFRLNVHEMGRNLLG